MNKRAFRVLIIDDAFFIRNLIKRAITTKPDDNNYIFEVTGEAKNGKEGLVEYFKLKPDFITLDLNMPDINGVEVIKQIQSKDPNVKIIVISGKEDAKLKEEIMELGAWFYVEKPFQNAFLWERMDNIVKLIIEEENKFPSVRSEEEPSTEIIGQEISTKEQPHYDNIIVISDDEEDDLFIHKDNSQVQTLKENPVIAEDKIVPNYEDLNSKNLVVEFSASLEFDIDKELPKKSTPVIYVKENSNIELPESNEPSNDDICNVDLEDNSTAISEDEEIIITDIDKVNGNNNTVINIDSNSDYEIAYEGKNTLEGSEDFKVIENIDETITIPEKIDDDEEITDIISIYNDNKLTNNNENCRKNNDNSSSSNDNIVTIVEYPSINNNNSSNEVIKPTSFNDFKEIDVIKENQYPCDINDKADILNKIYIEPVNAQEMEYNENVHKYNEINNNNTDTSTKVEIQKGEVSIAPPRSKILKQIYSKTSEFELVNSREYVEEEATGEDNEPKGKGLFSSIKNLFNKK